MPIKRALPASFASLGFQTPDEARSNGRKYRRLMIRSEGLANSGKTEFIYSCPGPGLVLACDRGFDASCDNPNPPTTRRDDFGMKVIHVPSASQYANPGETKTACAGFWLECLKTWLDALKNPDAKTVAIDGDNLSYDLQRLADAGKLSGVYPLTKYGPVKDARRAFYWKAWESGKIIVSTNWLKAEWVDIIGPDGNPVMDAEGKETKQRKTNDFASTGYPDQEYLWQIRIRHLYRPSVYNERLKKNIPHAWGIRILAAKANPEVNGQELWNEECSFEGLVSTVYPHIDLADWGL